jgi:methylmalonyl-CoA carboxyltransferase large subunit
MPTVNVTDLAATLDELQAQVAEMTKHIEFLEQQNAAAAARREPSVPPATAEPQAITEEELLAISAAIGAYLGVRAHIRQIRLVGTTAWAQQGRVSIQASHRLQG